MVDIYFVELTDDERNKKYIQKKLSDFFEKKRKGGKINV